MFTCSPLRWGLYWSRWAERGYLPVWLDMEYLRERSVQQWQFIQTYADSDGANNSCCLVFKLKSLIISFIILNTYQFKRSLF